MTRSRELPRDVPGTRRALLAAAGGVAGAAALAWLDGRRAHAAPRAPAAASPGEPLPDPRPPHHAPRARRLIYLFMSGGPSQIDLFDWKPALARRRGQELPASVRAGQRLTTMTASQASFPLVPSAFSFRRHGASGASVSELLPEIGRVADDLCFVRSMHTEQINHDPAVTFCQTGAPLAGRPSLGAWLAYGLGTENQDLPAFVAMVSKGSGNPDDQPLYDRLWGSGFLPSRYQGTKLRAPGDPVPFLSNPPGVDRTARRRLLDGLGALNRLHLGRTGDPEVGARIAQYELAFRMQASVPELADLGREPDSTFALYGEDARRPGSFAANCLLARRLVERGVRCVQLFHRGWDQHRHLPGQIRGQCRDVDRASAALVTDLKRRGLLDDTLVVWGGEFGRTVYCQGLLGDGDFGRDHHPRCYTVWLAGAGVRAGLTYGETDDLSYNVARDPVHVHDLNATILHLLGVDHTRLTYKFQGRAYRLTDVHGKVVKPLLA
jgi:hypothetical protein